MAITFDAEKTPYHIYRYTASGGTWSANLAASTAYDYFNNNVAVDDAIYIGFSNASPTAGNGASPWHDIKFYVGTALAADAITLAWEYHNNGTWAAIPDLVDNTNNFTTTGENWVTFPVPPRWCRTTGTSSFNLISTTIGGITSYDIWVRCRVTAVTNPTEGGAQSTQIVRCKDYTIDVANEAAATMTSIYNADVAAGWGLVTKDEEAFVLMANMKFTGTTSFTSTNEFIRIGTDTYGWTIWAPDATTSTTFGTKDADGYGISGSTLHWHTQAASAGNVCLWQNLKMYGSRMWLSSVAFGNWVPSGVCEFIDCIFDTYYLYMGSVLSAGSVIRRCLLDFTYLWYVYTGNLTMDAVYLSNGCTGILSGVGTNNLISNIVFNSTQAVARYYGSNVNLVNCTGLLNTKITSSSPNGTSDVWVKKKFTLDMLVQGVDGTAISGATVSIVDAQGTVIATPTTDGSGLITQQTLTVYQKLWAYPGWALTETDYNPFTITISKAGYKTKTMVLTMDEKREEVETLERLSPKFDILEPEKAYQEVTADGKFILPITEETPLP